MTLYDKELNPKIRTFSQPNHPLATFLVLWIFPDRSDALFEQMILRARQILRSLQVIVNPPEMFDLQKGEEFRAYKRNIEGISARRVFLTV